jgi:hypothetical protein
MLLVIIISFSVKIVAIILLILMSFLFQHMTCLSWFLFVSFQTHLILRINFVFWIILISLNYCSTLFYHVSIFINRTYCFSIRVLHVFPCRFLSLNIYLFICHMEYCICEFLGSGETNQCCSDLYAHIWLNKTMYSHHDMMIKL